MTSSFLAAPFIKEIGRGVKGARSLSTADARDLFAAMLDGRVSDLELGAILLALRIKGESVDEVAGFLDAAEASFQRLNAPVSDYAPIVIPSYNGARRMANLTPLLAFLLARAGAPVLLHGVQTDAGRVASAEILQALGILPSMSLQQAEADLTLGAASGFPVFMSIDVLAPRLANMLALRKILGLRNSTHTLVKIMQPFVQPALRLASYTHPEYLAMLSDYFTRAVNPERGDVFLMRGTEGETVANIKKVQQIDWFHAKQKTTLVEAQFGTDLELSIPTDVQGTAEWIRAVLDGKQAVPDNIAQQVEHCLIIAKRMKQAV